MKTFLLACCVVAVSACAQQAPGAETVERDEAAARRRGELVQAMIAKGLITDVDCARGQVKVNLGQWVAIADTKEAFTKLLADHCRDSRGTVNVTVVDAQSGRDLASFSGSGYSVR